MKNKIRKSMIYLLTGLIAFSGAFRIQDVQAESTEPSTQAGSNYTVGSWYSSRYNSRHTLAGREKNYVGRMFNIKLDGEEVYCIEPFAALPGGNDNHSAVPKTLAQAIAGTEHSANAQAKANSISLFKYYSDSPTQPIKNVIASNNITATDKKVALQYYIWETLGLTFEDESYGVNNPSETGFGTTVVKDVHYRDVWVPGETTHSFDAYIRVGGGLSPANVEVIRSGSGVRLRVTGQMRGYPHLGVRVIPDFMTIPNGSYKEYPVGFGLEGDISQEQVGRALVMVRRTSSTTGGYWNRISIDSSYKKEYFTMPAWYKNYRGAIVKEIAHQNSLQRPTMNETNQTVVLNNVATYKAVSGSSISKFLRDNKHVPTSRPSSVNYPFSGGTKHSYVWKEGDNLKVEPTINSPDGRFYLQFSSNDIVPGSQPEKAFISSNRQDLTLIRGVQGAEMLEIGLTVLKTGNIEINKKNADTGQVVPNTRFEVYEDAAGTRRVTDGNGVSTFTTNSSGKTTVRGLLSELSGTKTYYIKEVNVPGPLTVDKKLYPVTMRAGQTVVYSATNKEQLGRITINKRDAETGNILKDRIFDGAQFKVTLLEAYSNNGTVGSSQVITLSNGSAIANNLPLGRYEIEEIKAPHGYTLIGKKSISITNSYSNQEVSINNIVGNMTNDRQKGEITIVKQDRNTGIKLSDPLFDGAQFKVTLKTPETPLGVAGTSQVITIKNGEAKASGLDLGVYEIEEVKAPYGYVLEKNLVTINNQYTNQTVALNKHSRNVTNKRQTGQIEITKKDDETGLTLENSMFDGAEFKATLVKAHTPFGKVGYSENIIIKNGKAKTSDKLDLGLYEITEVKAPFGYILSKQIVDVNNDYSNQTVHINNLKADYRNDRQLGRVQIYKEDVITGNTPQGDASLDGAEYELRLVNYTLPKSYIPNALNAGDVVGKLTTDQSGKASIDNLELGVYDLVETKPSPGYVLNKTAVRLEVKYAGETVVTSTNIDQQSRNHKGLIDEINNLQKEVNDRISNTEEEFRLDRTPTPMTDYSVTDDSKKVTTNERPIMGKISLTKGMESPDPENDSGQIDFEPGAEFEIKHIKTGRVVDTLTTNTFGYAMTKYLPYGMYKVTQTKAADGYGLAKPFEVMINEDGKNNYYLVNNHEFNTRLTFVKRDAESGLNIPIEGVTFELYNQEKGGEPIKMYSAYPSSVYISKFKTDSRGRVTLPETLKNGTYWIDEILPPEGYYLDPNGGRIEVEINGQSTIIGKNEIVVDVPNTPQKGQVELNKRGILLEGWKQESIGDHEVNIPILEEGYLGGAEFDIVANDLIKGKDGVIHYRKGDLVETLTSVQGQQLYSSELPLGKYTLQEVKAPDGYLKDDTIYDFEFTPQQQDVRVDIKTESIYNDKQTVEFSFNKEFESSEWFGYEDNAWEKAIFGLFNKEEITVNGHTLEKDTLVGLTGLTKDIIDDEPIYSGEIDATFAGTYYIQELETDEAYQLDETQHDVVFEYKPDGKLIEKETIITPIKNDIITGDLELYKFDSENREVGLQNAEFELVAITNDGDKVLGQYKTDTDGYVYVKDLEYGSYYLHELKAPDGYVTDGKKIPITISENGSTIMVEKENKPTITQFDKVDSETGKHVENAELAVIGKDGIVIERWTSSSDPHIIKRLVVGETYTLMEVKAPDGYITAAPVEFTVENTAEIQMVEMINKLSETEFSKKSITNQDELPGAHMSIIDSKGNTFTDWISGKDPHLVKGLVVGEQYRLVEDLAPIGYATASDVSFVISDNNEIELVEMIDDVLKVSVSKERVGTGERVVGAHLQIISKASSEVVYEWVSDGTIHNIEKIALGEYILREVKAPSGYLLAEDIEFEITDTPDVHEIVMIDDVTKVEISKKDLTNNEELPGAKLEIIDKETGKVIHEWISTNKAHYIEELALGDYILRETITPNGHVTAEEVQFTVEATGDIQLVEMFDDITKVQISKKDITNGELLAGATLQLIDDKTGEVIHEWVSTNEAHLIERLTVGNYTIKETKTPKGYVTSADVKITVEDTGNIQDFEMFDDITKVRVSKKDITNGEELEGATLQIIDYETKEVIHGWVSTKEAHYIEKLPVGKYILTETIAPDGYVTSTSVVFTVEDTNEIQEVEMIDDITKTEIHKVDKDGNYVSGASLQVIDKETGEVVYEWKSSDKAELINKLAVGTYILREVEAPNGYLLADDIEFEVVDSGEVLIVEMINNQTTVTINKVDQNGEVLSGAKLQIINKETGEVIEEWVSGDKPFTVVGLNPGTYILREVEAPEGYEKAADQEFIVEATSEAQVFELINELIPVPETEVVESSDIPFQMNANVLVSVAGLIILSVIASKRKKED